MDITRRLRASAGLASAGPMPVPRDKGPLPASAFQEQMWLVDRMLPGSTAYVVRFALLIRGRVREDLMAAALEQVIRRHEALRTAIVRPNRPTDTALPLVQDIRPFVSLPLETRDLRGAGDPRAAAHGLLAEAAAGIRLDRPPLLQVRLLRTADREYVLGFAVHHAVTDAASNKLILRDLAAAYRNLMAGDEAALPVPVLQYGDVAAWERERLTADRLKVLHQYWTERLNGIPDPLPLPTDRPRDDARPAIGDRQPFTLPAQLGVQIQRLAKAERGTPFSVVLAAFAAVLARRSGCPDTVVGSAFGGRGAPGLAEVVGPLINSVPLRIGAPAGTSGRDLVRRAVSAVVGAQDHADLSFDRLVNLVQPRRSTSRHPIFQVNLGVRESSGVPLRLPDAEVEPLPSPDSTDAKFDLSVYLSAGVGEWTGAVEYDTRLFDRSTVAGFVGELRAVLEAMADDPAAPVAGLPPAGSDAATTLLGAVRARSASDRGHRTPPRDRWERRIAMVWEQTLAIEGVYAQDDFFSLGGHSMAGMLAADRLRVLTGRSITLADLIRNPTVAALASHLRTAPSSDGTRLASLLRAGGESAPLFFAPPPTGEPAMYARLLGQLAPGRPVLALQPDGFFDHGDPGDLDLAVQADVYAQEILRTAHHRPAHLCGFSAAGRFAVAIADALAQRNGTVGAVVLLDAAPFGDVAPNPDLVTVLARWLDFAPPAEGAQGLDRDAVIARVLHAGQSAGRLPADTGAEEFTRWCRQLEFGARALAGHGPLAYRGTVTLLHRADRTTRDFAQEWRDMPVGRIDAVPVRVDRHEDFVDGPQVREVARLIDGCLAAADSAAPQGAPLYAKSEE